MTFNGVWFECAPSAQIIDGKIVQAQSPSYDHIQVWVQMLSTHPEVQEDVKHRYVLTRHNCKNFHNWARRQWFFKNASPEQIDECYTILDFKPLTFGLVRV